MHTRHKVAILATYPEWLVDDTIKNTNSYYCVWFTALSELFEKLVQFEIHWIILSKKVHTRRLIHKRGQYFHILPRARKLIGLYTYYFHDSYLINKEIKRIKPDLIHAWGTEDCLGFAVRSFKGKKLLSLQGILTSYMKYGDVGKFSSKHSYYEKITLKSFNHITSESPWATKESQEINNDANYYLFEYAVETPFFDIERRIADKPFCLFGGTGTPIKNINMLIKAFSAPELSHITLYLAGPGKNQFQNLSPNIKVLGHVSRETMHQLLSETWCVVHPSLADCAPNIANEARVIGVPVILSSHCGSQQHIEEGKNGFVIEPNDVEALIKHVLHICSSQQTSLQMGSYKQDETRKKLSKERMHERITELYEHLLNSE